MELELENKGKLDLLQEVRDIYMIRIFYVRQLQKGLEMLFTRQNALLMIHLCGFVS